MRFDIAWFSQYLTLSISSLLIPSKSTYVVTGYSLIQQFLNILPGYYCLFGFLDSTISLITWTEYTSFNLTCGNCSTTGDAEYVLNWHQERLVGVLSGSGIYSSTAFINSIILLPILLISGFSEPVSRPTITGTSSPGKSYSLKSSLLPFLPVPEVPGRLPCQPCLRIPRYRVLLPGWPG